MALASSRGALLELGQTRRGAAAGARGARARARASARRGRSGIALRGAARLGDATISRAARGRRRARRRRRRGSSAPARTPRSGAALRVAGDARRGARVAAARVDLAHRCGADALEDHALAELRATGARPRRRLTTGAGALTPSERRIAELAAAGQQNREIAEALFVTTATVEYHLRNAYRKLGISSRTQLAGALGG